MRNRLTFALTLFLAACTSGPEPARVKTAPSIPPVRPTPPPAVPAASASWEDWPRTSGDWVYRPDERGSVALFGQKGKDADFLIRCDRQRGKVFLSRAGSFPEGETGRMTIRATTALQTYAVANSSGTPPYISAEVATTDPQLDAVAYSRGRFLVSVKGGADLVIPAWAEVGRVVEDCR